MNKQESPISIFFLHDKPGIGESFKLIMDKLGFQVLMLQKPSECLEAARNLAGSCDIMIVHKDLGLHTCLEKQVGINSEMVVTAMHDNNPRARIGIVSGEHPDGILHVIQLEADFYCAPEHIRTPWAFQQYEKRWVSDDEIALRGKEVAMPPRRQS